MANVRYFIGPDVWFNLETDRCLPFHVQPDRAEMQRRYQLGRLRKIMPVIILRSIRARTNRK